MTVLETNLKMLLPGVLLGLLLAPARADDAQVQAASDQLLAAAAVLPADALVGRVQMLAANSSLSGPARRRALHQFVVGLRQQPESSAGHAALDAVTGLRIPGLEPHPEMPTILHDPSGLIAAAQGTRNTWQFYYWQQRARRDLDHGALDFASALIRQPEPAAFAGAASAMRYAGAPIDAELLGRLVASEPRLAPLAVARFEATGDLLLLDALVAANNGGPGTQVVQHLDRFVGREQALKWWAAQLENPGLAPVAMAGLSRYPTRQTFAILARLLDDPQLGVAAAHGLGHFDQPWVTGELKQLLKEGSIVTQRRARDLLRRQEASQ